MMVAALIMRPWAVLMRIKGLHPYLYVDDIMVMARGQGRIRKFREAMNQTLHYLKAMGAQISPKKSHLFATNARDRDELRACLLYTSPSPRDGLLSRMPSSA